MSELQRQPGGYINLRGDADDRSFLACVMSAIGFGLPTTANTFTADEEGSRRAYWLGPDEWLISTERGQVSSIVGQLEASLREHAAAINDVSGGYLLIELAGEEGLQTLLRGTTLDIASAVSRAGHCAQTTLAKANILLSCIDDRPVYEIIVRRSFSEYLLRWLRQTQHYLAGLDSYSSTISR